MFISLCRYRTLYAKLTESSREEEEEGGGEGTLVTTHPLHHSDPATNLISNPLSTIPGIKT